MKTRLLAFVAIALMTGSLAATAAAIGTYTDRAAWRIAAGGGTGDIVEDFTAVFSHLPYDGGRFVISETGDLDGQIRNGGLLTYLDDKDNNDTITFTFDSPIRALGFSVVTDATEYVGSVISMTTNAGDSGSYTVPSSLTFAGFLFSQPTTSFTIDRYSGPYYRWSYHTVDDLEAFSTPEPSSVALFGLGLAGLALTRRRWH